MTYKKLLEHLAVRCDMRKTDAKWFADELIAEIQRQLVLGEEVRLPMLGRFNLDVVKPSRRISNLPGMEGKYQLTRVRRRLKFRQFASAIERMSKKGLLAAVVTASSGLGEGDTRVRRRRDMAKKKGEHVTVDVPDTVTSVTINLKDKKKQKGKESTSGKRRLLG